MTILELMHTLEMAHELYGDIPVDAVQMENSHRKRYWTKGTHATKDVFSILFHVDDRYKGEKKNES